MAWIGKYSSARDSVLHFMCLQDWANESFGDVATFGCYVWRISNTAQDVSADNGEIVSLLEQDSYGVQLTPELSAALTGHFLVREDSNGLVSVGRFATESALLRHYAALESTYNDFCGTEDGEN